MTNPFVSIGAVQSKEEAPPANPFLSIGEQPNSVVPEQSNPFLSIGQEAPPIQESDPWKELVPGFTGGLTAEETIYHSPKEGLYDTRKNVLNEVARSMVPFLDQIEGTKPWRAPDTVMEAVTMYAMGKMGEAVIPPVISKIGSLFTKKGAAKAEGQIARTVGDLIKEAEGVQNTNIPNLEVKPDITTIKGKIDVLRKQVGNQIGVDRNIAPIKSTSELEKLDFDILRSELGQVDLTPLKAPIEKFKGEIKSGLEYVRSPYDVLAADPSGNGGIIYRRLEEADRAKMMYLSQARKERLGKIKFAPDSDSAVKVGTLLDEYPTQYDIPGYKWAALAQVEKDAYVYYRQKWDEAADVLIDKGLLDKKRTIKSYLFRVFDKDTIYTAAKSEYDSLLLAQQAAGLDVKQTGVIKDRMEKLFTMIKEYEKSGTILYDYIPQDIKVPFLKERTGASGYSTDVVKAYDLYEHYFAKKIFDEPAIKDSLPLLEKMPEGSKEYTRWFMRHFMGMEKEPAFNNLLRTLTGFEYIKDMGFNIRSALVNATQNLNTIVEIGPRWTAEGAYRLVFDKEAKALWKASGHRLDVPSLRYGLVSKNMERFGKIPWYLFDKIEGDVNRGVAYVGGYYKALAEGKSPQLAKIAADDIIRNTQFIYGRVGAPRLTSQFGGPALMQYSTYSVKQFEFLKHLWKEDPKKLAAYLLLAGGIGEGLHQVGIDMSNALGIGLDYKEMMKGVIDLSKGNVDAAKIHAQLGLPKIMGGMGTGGSGIFPEGVIPIIGTLKEAVSGEWKKLIPLQAQRLMQSYGAIKEGQVNAYYPDEQGKQVLGYPLRDIEKGEARGFLKPWEIVSHAIGPRPFTESKEYIEGSREKLTEETRMKVKQDALMAYGTGDQAKFDRLMNKYGLVFVENDFNKLYINKFTTPLMRRRLAELQSTQSQSFRGKIEGNMP